MRFKIVFAHSRLFWEFTCRKMNLISSYWKIIKLKFYNCSVLRITNWVDVDRTEKVLRWFIVINRLVNSI